MQIEQRDLILLRVFEIRSRVCSTLSRNRSPRSTSRWSNQSRACWRSNAARLLRRTRRVTEATGAAGDEPSGQRAPRARARGFGVLVERLEALAQLRLDFRRYRSVLLIRVGTLRGGLGTHRIRLRRSNRSRKSPSLDRSRMARRTGDGRCESGRGEPHRTGTPTGNPSSPTMRSEARGAVASHAGRAVGRRIQLTHQRLPDGGLRLTPSRAS
jgi:hypothetical protein